MSKLKNKRGSLTLEACVVVLLFMFLMLYIYSFFFIFMMHGKMEKTLLKAVESVSLDSYAAGKLRWTDEDGTSYDLSSDGLAGAPGKILNASVNAASEASVENIISLLVTETHDHGVGYVSDYSIDKMKDGVDETNPTTEPRNAAKHSALTKLVKERFFTYFVAQDAGDGQVYTMEDVYEKADKILKSYGVIDGIDGVVFKEVAIADNNLTDNDLKVTVEYKMNHMFDYKGFGLKPLVMRHTAVSHLFVP